MQSVDGDSTDIECCQSSGSSDGAPCGLRFVLSHIHFKCTDSLDEERRARTSHPVEKHVQWFEVRTTALLFLVSQLVLEVGFNVFIHPSLVGVQ